MGRKGEREAGMQGRIEECWKKGRGGMEGRCAEREGERLGERERNEMMRFLIARKWVGGEEASY